MHDDGLLIVGELTALGAPGIRPMPGERKAVEITSPRLDRHQWAGKRAADVLLSTVLLVATLPIFVVLALVIKATSPGPVFFRQRRVGRAGEDFQMLKFRTMRADSEERLRSDPALYKLFLESGHKIPCRLDPRITVVGRVLRRLSLDELPQLLNVLRGHMSMVGPRPVERSQLVRDYGVYEGVYLALRPGLTGLWQVSGRSRVQFPERALLDEHYLRGAGPWLDTKIILRTPLAVFSGRGAD